jgi:hypothetical protein
MNEIINIIPEKYRGLALVLAAVLPWLTRALYALANGRGIRGTLSAIWFGTNAPKTPSPSTPNDGASKTGGGVFVFILAASLCFGAVGCHSTPQRVTYQAAATSSVTVETALQAYDVFAAQGKTTPQQNAAVKAAYERYQAAFAVVCDAGAVYASAGQTNAPAASAALQSAVLNANQAISDMMALLQSFGVKL